MIGSCCIFATCDTSIRWNAARFGNLEDGPEGEEKSLGDDAKILGDEDEIRTR